MSKENNRTEEKRQGHAQGSASDVKPCVFSYGTFAAYLAAVIEWKKQGPRAMSLRTWTKKLGIRAPSLLTMIAKGQRRAQPDLVHNLCRYLELNPKETEYAEAMAELERCRSIAARQRLVEKLRQLAPRDSELMIALDSFSLISKWYHTTILELFRLQRFREEPQEIADFLGGGITSDQVKESIELLLRLGLAKRDENGRLQKSTSRVRTPKQPSSSLRHYHKQMLTRANRAIDQQSFDERYITGLTMPIPASKIDEAFQEISDFRMKFSQKMALAADGSEEIYQLNLHLFRSTEKKAFVDESTK